MGEQATATEGACCVLLGCVAWWCWCTGLQDPPAARAHGRDANEDAGVHTAQRIEGEGGGSGYSQASQLHARSSWEIESRRLAALRLILD